MSAMTLPTCLVALFLVTAQAIGDECNCKKYPFEPDPPCWNECTVSYLQQSDGKMLHEVLGLSKPLAAKIAATSTIRDQPPTFTFVVDRDISNKFVAQLRMKLSREETEELSNRLKTIDEERAQEWLSAFRSSDGVIKPKSPDDLRN